MTIVAAAGATATTVAAASLRAAGVHLAAGGRIPPAAFAQFTFAGALLGGLLVAIHLLAATIVAPVLARQTTR